MPEDRPPETQHAPSTPHRRRPRPRRVVTHVVVFLVLGAIANVAITWALSLDPYTHRRHRTEYPEARATVASERGPYHWGMLHWTQSGAAFWLSAREWNIPDWLPTELTPEALVPPFGTIDSPTECFASRSCGEECRYLSARGWPCLAMWFEFENRSPGQWVLVPGSGVPTGLEPMSDWIATDHPRALPLRPIWPGFAINTILYGGLLWLLFFGVGFTRRAIRRRRGLCPACAYPRGNSLVCTECGTPPPPASAGKS